MNIYKLTGKLLPLLLAANLLHSQDFSDLVEKTWVGNEALQAKNFQLQQAEAALLEARALYLPTIGFGTQYTLAAGGRAIDFPVGDLLNPVYSTLNSLTNSQQFPSLENQSIQFLPNNFYDARIRIQQAIYNPDLAINRSAKMSQIELQNLEIKAYKRQLSREIMNAYFQWQQAEQAITIYQEADTLLMEADRTTRSMLRNGIALPSAVARIETEQAALHAQQIGANTQETNAWAYLIYLLDDSLTGRDQVRRELPELPDPGPVINGQREELLQLDQAIALQQLMLKKEDQFYRPRLGAQLDLGSQAFNFDWAPYALFGVNLTINLYDAKQHRYRQNQAQAAIQAQNQMKTSVAEQINLQTQIARNNLVSAIQQAETFQPRIQAAQKVYREVTRKYQEGTANYLELLDARTQITQAELAYSLARYQAWSKWAEFIYATAFYPIQ